VAPTGSAQGESDDGRCCADVFLVLVALIPVLAGIEGGGGRAHASR
jgi:hypothetical protein